LRFVRGMVAEGSRKAIRCWFRARAARRSMRDAITAFRSASKPARASRAAKAWGVRTSAEAVSRLPRISNFRAAMNHLFAVSLLGLTGVQARGSTEIQGMLFFHRFAPGALGSGQSHEDWGQL